MANAFGDEFTLEEYIDFMYNKDNEYRCANCPENEDRPGNLPCGQQHCWVSCHCAQEE